MKILVVEDDPMQRGVIAAALKARGDTVVEADSGEAAVEIVSSGAHHFDSILMDQRMPGIGGAEATRRIRTLPDWRGQVPIVAMSAADVEGRQQVDGVLAKDDLGRVQDILANAAATAQARVIADQQPSRAVLVNWMRINVFAIITLVVAFIGAVGGGIWGAGAFTADQRRQNQDVTARLDSTQKALVDVDLRLNKLGERLVETQRKAESDQQTGDTELERRINASENRVLDLRHARDAELNEMHTKIAVLEKQVEFFRDRVPSPQPLGNRR